MATPKPYADRQAELQSATAKLNTARDKAVAQLQIKMGQANAKARAEIAKLEQAAKAETEKLAAELARDEAKQLQPIVSKVVEASGAVTRDDCDTLSAMYRDLDRRSCELLGSSNFERCEVLLWCIASALVFDEPSELAKLQVFASVPDSHLEPARKAEIQAGTRGEDLNWCSLPGLNRLGFGRLYASLTAALKARDVYRIGPLMRDVAAFVDQQIQHSGASADCELAAERIKVMRYAGLPAVQMRQLRAIHEREDARLRPKRDRLNSFHAAMHRLRQRINGGWISAAEATQQLSQAFPDARELAAEIGVHPGFGSDTKFHKINAPDPAPHVGDSLAHRGSVPFDPFASLRVAQAQASQPPAIDPYQGVQRPVAEGENYIVTRWVQ